MLPKMSFVFALVFGISLFRFAQSEQCPEIYQRFSTEHSYCQPRNNSCHIFQWGVNQENVKLIVDLHNQYRNKVAMGREGHAGGFPEAANMLQMVWDPELAAVAQKRAERCIYAHDCNDCRRVQSFPVGQNIAYLEKWCTGGTCHLRSTPDWTAVMKMFNDEVSYFDKRYLQKFVFAPGERYGHFSQDIWANTWRVGCGYVAFEKGSGYRQFYVCNYGPSGNIVNEPVYKIGPPCSSCPLNSCCGSKCRNVEYPGLCRMASANEAPLYPPNEKYIFHCDFRRFDGDCSVSVLGPRKWNFIPTVGGSFAEVIVHGGESSILNFLPTIKPKKNFCLIVKYKAGPILSGQKAAHIINVVFNVPNAKVPTMTLPPNPGGDLFFTYTLDLNWNFATKFGFLFTVPKDAPPQYFDIKDISVKEGKCR